MEINKYFFCLIVSVTIASFSQMFLKKAASQEHKSFIKEYLNANVIIGYGMMFISTVLTIIGYTKIDYKNGPIIESLGYLLVMILSFLFFKEKISFKKVIGNALILFGIFIFYL